MITANGKLQVQRLLARQANQIGGALALGVGTKAANVNDVNLEYEVVRTEIISTSIDSSTGDLVFRAQFNPGSIKTVYEMGVWSSTLATSAGYSMGLLGASLTPWTNGTLTSTNARANLNALQVNYVANGTTNAELTGFFADLSGYTDSDSIVVAYYATTNLSSVRIRLGRDSSNYYEFVLPAPVANSYNVARLQRSAATKTGTLDWSSLTYAAVRPSATAGGSGSIFFDGVRVEPNSLSTNNLLVARTVLTTPHTLDADITSDIEYSLKVMAA